MLLALTSQIMAAAAMTCEPGKTFKPSKHSALESHLDHSMHEMNPLHGASEHEAIKHGGMEKADQSHSSHHQSFCCKTMAHCLLACALIANSNNFLFHLELVSLGVDDFYSNTATNPFIPSLYRPPILS